MRYRCLLFDADGTLFDYDGAEATALERILAEAGHAMGPEVRALYRRLNAALWDELEAGTVDALTLRYRRFERLYAELGLPSTDARGAAERYLVELARCGDLLPGAERLVRSLVDRVRMALITNGLADVQRPRLAGSPIAGAFETITISDELGIAKPDRRIIDHTLEALGGIERAEVLIIGDSLSSDIQGGVNAGIDTCWVTTTRPDSPPEPAPTYVIESLDELPAIVAG